MSRPIAVAVVAIALGLSACATEPPPVVETPPPPAPDLAGKAAGLNVVLISLDALRFDHTGIAGAPTGLTPNLDRLAGEAVVFHDTLAAASWTLPSHMSVWTGLWPSRHGVTNKLKPDEKGEMARTALDAAIPTYTDRLIQAGYTAAAFTGGAGVQGSFGYGRAFDRYQDDRYFGGFDYGIDPALEWVEAHRERPFFLFLHGYDVHGQYALPPEEIAKVRGDYAGALDGGIEEQAKLREQGLATITGPGVDPDLSTVLTPEDAAFLDRIYDRKIQIADERVGRFLDRFREMGLMDRTLIVLMSDHGEEFLEHRGLDHGHTLYQEQLGVLMAMRVPGEARRVDVRTPVRLLDLFPTVFDLLGLPGIPGVDGKSLLPTVRGEAQDLPLFAESDYRLFVHHRAVRRGSHKLILDLADNRKQLFDLATDPGERTDLSATDTRTAYEMEQVLRAWLDANRVRPEDYLGVQQEPIRIF